MKESYGEGLAAHTGRESLIGVIGVARTRLDPRGIVMVRGERWDATADDPPIEEDAPVVVLSTDGLKLRVKRDPASIKLLPAPPIDSEPETSNLST